MRRKISARCVRWAPRGRSSPRPLPPRAGSSRLGFNDGPRSLGLADRDFTDQVGVGKIRKQVRIAAISDRDARGLQAANSMGAFSLQGDLMTAGGQLHSQDLD